jgi:hypothetical protein
MKFFLYFYSMRLLRLDLTRRGYVEDFEFFETNEPDLDAFSEMLFEQEQEHIFGSIDDEAERLERLDEVDFYTTETYVEFYYVGGFYSRFYLVDHEDNQDLIEAANKENIDSIEYQYLNEVMQKKLQKS